MQEDRRLAKRKGSHNPIIACTCPAYHVRISCPVYRRLQRRPRITVAYPAQHYFGGFEVCHALRSNIPRPLPRHGIYRRLAHVSSLGILRNFAYAEIGFVKPCGVRPCPTRPTAICSDAHVSCSGGTLYNFTYAKKRFATPCESKQVPSHLSCRKLQTPALSMSCHRASS